MSADKRALAQFPHSPAKIAEIRGKALSDTAVLLGLCLCEQGKYFKRMTEIKQSVNLRRID